MASDGLWDVADADTAVRLACESQAAGRDASTDLVDWALEQHDNRGTIDNVTVVVAFFRQQGGAGTPGTTTTNTSTASSSGGSSTAVSLAATTASGSNAGARAQA